MGWASVVCFALAGLNAAPAAHSLCVKVSPRFGSALLSYDTPVHRIAGGQDVSVTRLDFLLSEFALRATNGAWLPSTTRFAYLSGREGRTSFTLSGFPSGRYDCIRLQVGVPPAENHAKPTQFDAAHPLNPNVNGLHWSWQGGYVFFALEGSWSVDHRGYSFHLATDRLLTTIELPLSLDLRGDATLHLALDVDTIFSRPHRIALTDEAATTHSRDGDAQALQLRDNLAQAFAILTNAPTIPARTRDLRRDAGTPTVPEVAASATPHPFTFPDYFPRPELPLDNPLTVEGIELGRRLFHDPRLSVNSQQSCASCHQPEVALMDAGRRYSTGAEGRQGTRNSMPLFNLAWKRQFFWDGRAPSLRAQVLMPIENPIEMHETVTNILAKLSAGSTNVAGPATAITDCSAGFAAAFGTPEITSDRLARALEQFLLAQVSRDSKFDRVLAGTAAFNEEEQRGFTLFHTEYDPRRGQYGADCFHCHGGPLFQSQTFANNGLDATSADPGRYAVTKQEGDRGRFAVPSLRNVEVTGPYMHDGRFATLEKVIAHYATGIRRSPTLDPNLAKHPDGGVPLTDFDQRALVAFLHTLTDERFRPADSRRAAR